MNPIDEILDMFEARGHSLYGGEAVTQREHALQAAALAESENAPASLIVAALLHDLGHLLHDLPSDAPMHGLDDQHEAVAGKYLERHFQKSVTEPVRLHVAAKRYLCAVERGYGEQLSLPSKVSLALQGGPMTPDEVTQFQQHPFVTQAVRLRKWDDEAKEPTRTTPPISHFVRYLQEVLGERDIQ